MLMKEFIFLLLKVYLEYHQDKQIWKFFKICLVQELPEADDCNWDIITKFMKLELLFLSDSEHRLLSTDSMVPSWLPYPLYFPLSPIIQGWRPPLLVSRVVGSLEQEVRSSLDVEQLVG